MNQDVFFKNFELLTDVPNGVQKLRELILQLAVMGKLVPQDPNDELATVLLQKIKAKKNNGVKGNTKKSILSSVNSDEIPYEIPPTWVWTQLTDVYDVRDGTHDSPKYSTEGFPLVTSKNLSGGYLNLTNIQYISELDHIKISERSKVDKDDILFAMIGSIGNPVIVDVDVEFSIKNVALFKYYSKDLSVPRYLKFFLEIASHNMRKQANGGVQSFVSLGYLRKYPFPLPPLAEQKRIVSKVDELMSLCDKLETRRQKKQDLQSKLNSSALDKMLSAENQEEFEQYWQRICENFDLLYDNPENVEKLKQAILQLAVQGKLVEQNPEDEPASVLIEKIKNEKTNLVKIGKIKGTKSVSLEMTDNTSIFPEKWESVDLDSIILFMDAGWSPACKNHPTEDEQTWGVLKTTSVQPLMFLWTEHKELPENLTPRPEYEVRAGDILITRAGPKNRVGICCLVKDTRSRLMISDKIIRFHLLDKFVFPEFVTLCLNTGFSQSFIGSQKSGMAESQMNISQNKLRMTPIPLPPLNEQKRIVEKVEQLMGLCDELESKLRKSREDSEKLMEAVVKGLLEDAATEKIELDRHIPVEAAAIQLK